LATRKLDFKQKYVYKRSGSYKGRENFILNQYEREECENAIKSKEGKEDDRRPVSKRYERTKQVKYINKTANPYKPG
jgi:hypothetical protein